ncbi:hypothetical protein CRG98_016901 [Punica granatum]|uniref:Uncharacterized protein n=1 Tax=Punica granatum TaxID=22663 RepID=A0A2I0K4R3_PUNGR|nr:hypothetical protein CRG98_016901 [Punica granatum]
MDRPAPDLRLEAITPPRPEIMCIWRTFRSVDRAFIQDIIGDVVMFTETPVDWIFLRTAAEFWDPQHAGSTSPQRSQTTPIPRAAPTSVPEAENSTQVAMRAELQSIKKERDRLRCELVDSRVEVADYRELQTELARARTRIATLDWEMARLSATLD